MFTLRCFLCAVLLSTGFALAGCEYLSNVEPQENHGGFNVLVDLPGQPTAPRVFADIGTFARQRGFVRTTAPAAPPVDPAAHQPPPPAPERYVLGKITLDVTYDTTHLWVSAYLHGFSHRLDHKFIDNFYQGFAQENAGRYGDTDTIIESDDGSGAAVPSRGGGRRGGR